MITCHEYNIPMYNMHKPMGTHYTWQNMVVETLCSPQQNLSGVMHVPAQ